VPISRLGHSLAWMGLRSRPDDNLNLTRSDGQSSSRSSGVSTIIVDGPDLVARALTRTRRVPGLDIERFDPLRTYPTWLRNGVRVLLNGGQTIALGVFGALPADSALAVRR
jgi:hypothetical protein